MERSVERADSVTSNLYPLQNKSLGPDSAAELRLAQISMMDILAGVKGPSTGLMTPLSVGSQDCFLMLLGFEQLLWSNIHLHSFSLIVKTLLEVEVGLGTVQRDHLCSGCPAPGMNHSFLLSTYLYYDTLISNNILLCTVEKE